MTYAHLLGQKHAAAAFGLPPAQISSAVSATKLTPKPPMPPKAPAAPRPLAFPARPVIAPPAPNLGIAAGRLRADGQAAVANAQKLGEWSLRPKPQLAPWKIAPDNGTRTLGNNFDMSGSTGISDGVRRAWDSHNTQRNSDPINLNALNEGVIPSVGG